MEQVRYMISDAANIVAVESHVLRYWEDELELTVPRNELGHRYYTQENVDQFLRIKQLKEEGYQLKAIKILLQQEKQAGLHKEQPTAAEHVTKPRQAISEPVTETARMEGTRMEETRVEAMRMKAVTHLPEKKQPDPVAAPLQMSPQERMEQFQNLMTQIVRNAMTDNNKDLSQEIGTEVGERVLKEMNYLMRMQDEQEEERFKKLDEAIRSHGKRQKKSIRRKKPSKRALKTAPGME